MPTSHQFSINNQRGVSPILIVLGVVLVLALVGLAYYLATGNPVSTQPAQVPVPAKVIVKPSPTASASASVNPTVSPKPSATPGTQTTASPSATPR